MRSGMRLAVASHGDGRAAAPFIPDSAAVTDSRAGVLDLVRLWICRHRERKALAELTSKDALSDHILRDIGLTRAAARAESEKPFWRG